MLESKDQMNNVIRLGQFPNRIISLVPSLTELLFDLQLENEVIGITKFCIHPNDWFQSKTRVGGTKTVDIEKVRGLNPDLIIANKEENTKEDIDQLKLIAPVWVSDINSYDEALVAIEEIAKVTGRETQGKSILFQIENGFNALQKIHQPKRVAYLIWNNPAYLAGKETFINDMLEKCGLINITNESRYPEMKVEVEPDFIFLSSEPFPFEEKHKKEFEMKFPLAKIVLVDGEMFSWYGSRMIKSPNYFNKLIAAID